MNSRNLTFYLREIPPTVASRKATGSWESGRVCNGTVCFAQHLELFAGLNDAGPERL